MEVVLASESLAHVCADEREMRRTYGPEAAKKLQRRLVQLDGVGTLADMCELPGRCHELAGDRRGQLAIELHGPLRLIFKPTTDPPPRKPDGGLDWGQVQRITVLEIVDYH